MFAPPRSERIDIPFRVDDEIQDLIIRFEQLSWPYERWTYRAHLAVAVAYLKSYSLAEAIDRIRRNIQLYNRTCGHPDGYHETVTRAFMELISRRMSTAPTGQSLVEIVDNLFDELSLQHLLKYYSPDRLWSPEARASWVIPDLVSFDGD